MAHLCVVLKEAVMRVKAFNNKLLEMDIHPDMLPLLSGVSSSDIQEQIRGDHIGYRLRSVIRQMDIISRG